MIIFTTLYNITVFLLLFFRRFIATLILKHILGWRINRNYDSYEQLRKGRHVMVYAHTSVCDPLIGYLVAIAYDLPLIGVAKRELCDVPFLGRFIRRMSAIFIDRQKNTNTTKYISEELDKITHFVFAISPEGTRSLTNDLKSGFFYIAEKTRADLWIAHFDFENQVFSVEEIVNDVVIQTTEYRKIKELVETEIKKEKPYHPDRCYLVDPDTMKKTSLIGIKRTVLIYIPPFIVIMILINIMIKIFGF